MRYVFASALFLAACSAGAPDSPSEQLAAAMAGEYVSVPGQSGNVLRDRRFRLKGADWQDGVWLYYQINRGPTRAAQDEVYRQRVLHLVDRPDGSVAQTAYTLADPKAFAAFGLDKLTKADLASAMAEGCELIWRGESRNWTGVVDPDTCIIDSQRRQTRLRIGSRSELYGDTLRQSESGYAMDGSYLWGSKQGEFLVLERSSHANR